VSGNRALAGTAARAGFGLRRRASHVCASCKRCQPSSFILINSFFGGIYLAYRNLNPVQMINRRKWMAKFFIFVAAFLSMLFSIYLFHSGETQRAIFVGIWVPSILSAGALLMVGHRE
jgi:hypothetical protein